MLTLGTDPEFFLHDGEKVRSASEIFPPKGEPWEPWKAQEYDLHGVRKYVSHRGTKVFRDGFGVEVNVPPSQCRETLTGNLSAALIDIRKKLKEMKKVKWTLLSAATVETEIPYIDTLPEDVKQFGCDPAFSAWTEREERIDLNGAVHPLRYGGGHLHFGDDLGELCKIGPISQKNPERRKDIFFMIRLLDLAVGLPLSLIFSERDEFQRREFYGKAGEFRFQPWGVEYRTPSSRVWNHPMIASLALGVGRDVIEHFPKWKEVWVKLKKERKNLEEDLQKAVNEGKGGVELLQEVSYWYGKNLITFLQGEGRDMFKLNKLTLDSHSSQSGLIVSLRDIGKTNLIPVVPPVPEVQIA